LAVKAELMGSFPSPQIAPGMLPQLVKRNYRFYGAKEGNTWVGLARAHKESFDDGHALYIEDVTSAGGGGIGARLIGYIMRQAEVKEGCKAVTLNSAHASLYGFYRKIGFEKDPKTSRFMFKLTDAGLGAMGEHIIKNKPEKCWVLEGDAYGRTPKSIVDIIGDYMKD
jgi:hypothetical protein